VFVVSLTAEKGFVVGIPTKPETLRESHPIMGSIPKTR